MKIRLIPSIRIVFMLHWKIEERTLPLKYSWKLSRNTSEEKTNFFVEVGDDKFKGTGEVAPNIRYGELPEIIRGQFAGFLTHGPETITSLSGLESMLPGLHLAHALRFGIESAFIHYLAAKSHKSVTELLKISPPGPIRTAYTLPMMEPGKIAEFIKTYKLERFPYIKVKVNAEAGMDMLKETSKYILNPLMIDGNEDWKDVEEVIRFIEKIRPTRIEFLEQPMPSSFEAEYRHLKKHSSLPIMADESCMADPDFESLAQQFDGINMKLMKAGGYLNGLRILKEARKMGMRTMIGCMVETTLGISSAMNLCHGLDYIDLDGFLILEEEPFHLVEEQEGRLYLLK